MAETRNGSLRANDGGPASGRHDHLTDEGLVEAIALHDRAALAAAYSQHGARVHALARGLCGDARAKEVTREVFLQLWNDPQLFGAERGSLRSCLLMQAHGRAVALLRGDAAGAARESRPDRPADAERSGAEAVAPSLLGRAEVDELVAALPARERHLIVLAYFGGHTYRDVARLVAVPEATIKRCIRSGLERLRTEGASEPSFI